MKRRFFYLFSIMLFVAGYNIYSSAQKWTVYDLTMANVEALASDESGFSWTCKTYDEDVYTETRWDYEGQCYTRVVCVTYACSRGVLGSCVEGYSTSYYDCKGNLTGYFENTYYGGCWG